MKEAVKEAEATTTPIQLIAENGSDVHTYMVNYHDGLRYPHLERNGSERDLLSEILEPLAR